jgi:hypothetical protein
MVAVRRNDHDFRAGEGVFSRGMRAGRVRQVACAPLTHQDESITLRAMTKRLQVLFEDDELAELQRIARRHRMTTAEWVRRSLRLARDADGGSDTAQKLAAIRAATAYAFPTGDIDTVLGEIEQGYLGADDE